MLLLLDNDFKVNLGWVKLVNLIMLLMIIIGFEYKIEIGGLE